MGPALYEDLVLPFDARQNRFAAERHGVVPRAAIHHCDVPLDPFIDAACRQHGRQPQYEPMPLCWEEIQWAHGRYQGMATT